MYLQPGSFFSSFRRPACPAFLSLVCVTYPLKGSTRLFVVLSLSPPPNWGEAKSSRRLVPRAKRTGVRVILCRGDPCPVKGSTRLFVLTEWRETIMHQPAPTQEAGVLLQCKGGEGYLNFRLPNYAIVTANTHPQPERLRRTQSQPQRQTQRSDPDRPGSAPKLCRSRSRHLHRSSSGAEHCR